MSIDRDLKTISWKAAFDLIIVAEAVKVVSHNNDLCKPRCNVETESSISLYLPNNLELITLHECQNKHVVIDNNGFLWFKDYTLCKPEGVGIRLLNASPVIVP